MDALVKEEGEGEGEVEGAPKTEGGKEEEKKEEDKVKEEEKKEESKGKEEEKNEEGKAKEEENKGSETARGERERRRGREKTDPSAKGKKKKRNRVMREKEKEKGKESKEADLSPPLSPSLSISVSVAAPLGEEEKVISNSVKDVLVLNVMSRLLEKKLSSPDLLKVEAYFYLSIFLSLCLLLSGSFSLSPSTGLLSTLTFSYLKLPPTSSFFLPIPSSTDLQHCRAVLRPIQDTRGQKYDLRSDSHHEMRPPSAGPRTRCTPLSLSFSFSFSLSLFLSLYISLSLFLSLSLSLLFHFSPPWISLLFLPSAGNPTDISLSQSCWRGHRRPKGRILPSQMERLSTSSPFPSVTRGKVPTPLLRHHRRGTFLYCRSPLQTAKGRVRDAGVQWLVWRGCGHFGGDVLAVYGREGLPPGAVPVPHSVAAIRRFDLGTPAHSLVSI